LLGATTARDHLVEHLWGKTFVSTPTETASERRRSDSGFPQPGRGIPHELHRHLN